MRQLRHHEQRLLKKVDFLQWKNEHNLRELQVGLVGGAPCTPSSSVFACPLRLGSAAHRRAGRLPAAQVMRRYHIQDRDDYTKYNKLCGMVTRLVATLKKLDPRDSARIELTDQLLNK
jgi:U3 small nucleolar ribonucleoprotein protein IMP3